MSQILLWLDSQELKPVRFKFTTDGRLGFDIGFRSKAEAAAAEAFHWRSFSGASDHHHGYVLVPQEAVAAQRVF